MIEIASEPPVNIDRCTSCLGMFFNPGEMESLLDARTNPLVWLDTAQLNQIAADFAGDEEVVYRKCPVCAERMSRVNFGRHSGVIIDQCGAHGVWLDGSKLRRLTEWWRAGGRLIYQENEARKTKSLYAPPDAGARPVRGDVDSPVDSRGSFTLVDAVVAGVAGVVSMLMD